MSRSASFFMALVIGGCAAPHHATKPARSIADGIYSVQFTAATIEPRRPDGSPWHVSAANNTGLIVGTAAGLAVGNPELGAVGAKFDNPGGEAQAPKPYVVFKLEGASWTIGPAERSYSPTWSQAIEIRTWAYRGDEQVLIQVVDAVDNALLARGQLRLADLLARPAQTITNLKGSVPSLDVEVATRATSELDDLDLNSHGD